MAVLSLLLGLVLVLNLVLLILVVLLIQRPSGTRVQAEAFQQLTRKSEALHKTLSQQFASATADMATRLEQTKGDLRQQLTDRLGDGFSLMRNAVEEQ